MKIILIKGLSQYGALRYYIDQWNDFCQKKGHKTVLFDALAGDTTEKLKEMLQTIQPEVVISCNAMYAEIIEKIMPEQCLFCTVLYDNPVFHGKRLASLGSRSIVFSCDRFYADFIRDNYPDIQRVGFLPLSGNQAQERRPYREREIDLLFTGSYFDLNKSYQTIKQLPENIQIIAENIIEIMIQEPSTVLWQACDQVLAGYGIQLAPAARLEILNLYQCIDQFVRAYVRDQVMLQIVDAEIPVHIFGNGWEQFKCHHPENIIFHKGAGEDSLRALANAKISLNVMPWFRGGIQERNIAAMLAGAISLTDSSTYIEEHFRDGEDIVLYSLKQTEQIPAIIRSVLDDDAKGEKIAYAGYHKAVLQHTWEHRVTEMLRVIELEKGIGKI